MRTALRNIVGKTYRPLLVKYLSKTRIYQQGDIRLEIPPQVFHPGFFFSTKMLLRYVNKLALNRKKLLELGAGSGFISITAARKGAIVTATDINPVAIEYLHKNCDNNGVKVNIIQSDLFASIPQQLFDIIAINPPYYKKKPGSWQDHAWFCGENGEYFSGLFSQLRNYIHPNTEAIMILCEGCDIEMIRTIASQHGFDFRMMIKKQYLLEKNYIYKIDDRHDRP